MEPGVLISEIAELNRLHNGENKNRTKNKDWDLKDTLRLIIILSILAIAIFILLII